MSFSKIFIYFFFSSSSKFIFFSTNKVECKIFIDEIEIQKNFENNFNKEILINKGFKKAFEELMGKLVQSKDLIKLKILN